MSLLLFFSWCTRAINVGVDILETAFSKFGLSALTVFAAMCFIGMFERFVMRKFL